MHKRVCALARVDARAHVHARVCVSFVWGYGQQTLKPYFSNYGGLVENFVGFSSKPKKRLKENVWLNFYTQLKFIALLLPVF